MVHVFILNSYMYNNYACINYVHLSVVLHIFVHMYGFSRFIGFLVYCHVLIAVLFVDVGNNRSVLETLPNTFVSPS